MGWGLHRAGTEEEMRMGTREDRIGQLEERLVEATSEAEIELIEKKIEVLLSLDERTM